LDQKTSHPQNYTDIFDARGHLYNEAGSKCPQARERERAALLDLLQPVAGEVICDATLITRIAPDEAPYPEPEQIDRSVRLQPDSGADSNQNTPYAEIIDRVSAREGVDAKLVRAVIEVESGYRPRARSPKGAMGLMQLMPATARQYAVTNPYDPAANIEAGIKHLKSLLARFPPALALAAYNAGDAAVERFGGIPPYAETRNYVSRILQIFRRS